MSKPFLTGEALRAHLASLPQHPPKEVIVEGLRYLIEVDALAKAEAETGPKNEGKEETE